MSLRENVAHIVIHASILAIVMWVWFATACTYYPSVDSKGNPVNTQMKCWYSTGFSAIALTVMAFILLIVTYMLP